MTLNTYLAWLWIVAAVALIVWTVASFATYIASHKDHTRIRLLFTLVLATTALVIADIARFRWRVTVFGIPPNANSHGVAIYRTTWTMLLWICTAVLYGPRFWAWVRGRR